MRQSIDDRHSGISNHLEIFRFGGREQSSLTEIPRYLIMVVRSRAKVNGKVGCQQLARQIQGG